VADIGNNIDRVSREMAECVPWKQPCEFPFCLILAGDTLIAGGNDAIAAFKGADGKLIWQGAVTGKAYGLAAANGRVFASTDQGTIHCFAAVKQPVDTVLLLPLKAQSRPEIQPRQEMTQRSSSESVSPSDAYRVATGPFVEWEAPTSIKVTWSTETAMSSVLEFGESSLKVQRFEDSRA